MIVECLTKSKGVIVLDNKLSESNKGFEGGRYISNRNPALVSHSQDRARGAYLASHLELLRHVKVVCANRVINLYRGEELTTLYLSSLRDKKDIPIILKSFLSSKSAEITRGIPIKVLIDSEIIRLENKVVELCEKNKTVKKTLPETCIENEKLVIDIEREIDWLTDHYADFTSISIMGEVANRCLAWDKPITEQPLMVKKAISELGADGALTVNGRNFLCRNAAVTYLDDLVEMGVKASLRVSSTVTGRDVYFFLLEKHGCLLPCLLFGYGVYAVSYNDSQAFTCLVNKLDI